MDASSSHPARGSNASASSIARLAPVTTMGLPASSSSSSSSSSAQLLLLHFAYFLLSLSLDAPNTNSVAAAASPFSFSFDFTDTSSYRSDDLTFEGDAGVHGKLVDLTCNSFAETTEGCTGRMSYRQPVPFYDKTTGEVASFSTRFTFAINTNNINSQTSATVSSQTSATASSQTSGGGTASSQASATATASSQTSSTAYKPTSHTRGDGMAFFLAYYPSSLPPYSGGGKLGLLSDDGTTASDEHKFVAIEFDTFNNPGWDPSDTSDHIGIDISSVKSVNTTLDKLSLKGSMTASITFDNTTKMLVASLQFADNPSAHPVEVSTKLPDPQTLLPSEVAVGFSASTDSAVELHQILSWSFSSTLAPPPKGPSHDKKATILIGGSIGGALVLVLLAWFIISWCKLISKRYAFERGTGGTRRFEYRDLAAATDNFSKKKKLGQGAFGEVYRGTPLKGLVGEVAVKKILTDSKGGHADFFAELNTIGVTNHRNLVKLEGWCCRGASWNILDFICWCRRKKTDDLFLVYELVPNGNLFDHLHNRGAEVLPWPTRYKIVKDIGVALVYLHEQCHQYILHRDIKPSNILLDNHFNAKLADFGLSRVSNQDNTTLLTTAIGTEGYIDPQCRRSGVVEFKRSSDVYSFGVVLLDIACRQGIRIEEVRRHYRVNTIVEAADDKLNGEFDGTQMERVIVLGLWCTLSDSTKRPTIRQAMDVLERDTPLPNLINSVSTQDTYDSSFDPQAPISAGSSSNEQHP